MLTLLQKKTIAAVMFCLGNASLLQAMNQNHTALQLACIEGNEKKVEDLIKQGFSTNIKISTIDFDYPNQLKIVPTPLHCAAEKGHSGIIKLLLNANANINSTHCLYGGTPLHVAAWFKKSTCINALRQGGAKLDSTNKFGSTPIHLAAYMDDLPCLEELLKDNPQEVNYTLCTTKNNDGKTPIDLAIESKSQDCINKFLEIISSNYKVLSHYKALLEAKALNNH